VPAAPETSPVPVYGLTGAIAAGKSEALAALERLGAATLSSDAVVHDLLGGAEVRDLLVDRWGSEVAPEGVVDRVRVGEIVFADPAELKWLESILHPRVGERIAVWRAGLDSETPLAVVEVPLLFETGMEGAFDATICVIAAEGLRADRAGARRTADLDARAGRQLTQDEKARRATHVVRNDGSIEDLERALAALMPGGGEVGG
jgi:dephospho-CoA kinase